MTISYKGQAEEFTWKQVRGEVLAVNPELASIIDELNPNDEFKLLKASYPYGAKVLDRALLMLPNQHGDIVPITDSSISDAVRERYGYNLQSNPVSIVLKNSFEVFLPLTDRTIPFSGIIKEGTAFGAWRALNPNHSEQPAFIWDMTAGARSVFMLPKITEELKHKKLEKTFGLTVSTPRSLMQHFEVFRQLANSSQATKEPWDAEILYFSADWFNHLMDLRWAGFYQHFYHSTWLNSEFWRNKFFWDIVFSLILQDYEARPNAHIMDTVQALLYMGVGSAPGMGPVHNTLAGPFDLIQTIYQNVYEIRNYPPIIIQPQNFAMRDPNAYPVYYSLQFANALVFKPSTRVKSSIVSDLHDIRSLLLRCKRDLCSDKFNIAGTSLHELFNYAHYDYFHTGAELHEGMRDSSEMAEDVNLRTTLDGKVHEQFPNQCLFGKGCIRVSPKI